MGTTDLGAAAVELTAALIAIESVNPGLVPDAPGETRPQGEAVIAALAADRLAGAGLRARVLTDPDDPRRASVLAVHDGGPGPTVVLNGHLDTVGVAGMTDPFTARIDGDRMTGRGSCDMKAGVAGLMVAAAELAATGFPGRVVVALVADEEDASTGTPAVLAALTEDGISPDACLVGEPTWLDLAIAHRGFGVAAVRLRGRAAHSSRPQDGVNAVAHLGRLLVAVEAADGRLRQKAPHPMLGHASLMATVASGGQAPFSLAADASAIVEARTLPGDPLDTAVDAAARIMADLAAADPQVSGTVEPVIARAAWQIDTSGAAADLADALAAALPAAGAAPPRRVGMPYWMESALWQAAGVPAVVCGPAGGGLHATDEWVDLAQVRAYPVAVVDAVRRFASRG